MSGRAITCTVVDNDLLVSNATCILYEGDDALGNQRDRQVTGSDGTCLFQNLSEEGEYKVVCDYPTPDKEVTVQPTVNNVTLDLGLDFTVTAYPLSDDCTRIECARVHPGDMIELECTFVGSDGLLKGKFRLEFPPNSHVVPNDPMKRRVIAGTPGPRAYQVRMSLLPTDPTHSTATLTADTSIDVRVRPAQTVTLTRAESEPTLDQQLLDGHSHRHRGTVIRQLPELHGPVVLRDHTKE